MGEFLKLIAVLGVIYAILITIIAYLAIKFRLLPGVEWKLSSIVARNKLLSIVACNKLLPDLEWKLSSIHSIFAHKISKRIRAKKFLIASAADIDVTRLVINLTRESTTPNKQDFIGSEETQIYSFLKGTHLINFDVKSHQGSLNYSAGSNSYFK